MNGTWHASNNVRSALVLIPLLVAQIDDWESMVAVMVECLGVRFWEQRGSISPQAEKEVIASCNYEWMVKLAGKLYIVLVTIIIFFHFFFFFTLSGQNFLSFSLHTVQQWGKFTKDTLYRGEVAKHHSNNPQA